LLDQSYIWFDVGTPERLFEASTIIKHIEDTTNSMILSPEEIAFSNGWINATNILACYEKYGNTRYGNYIKQLLI